MNPIWQQSLYAGELLLERRLWLFLIADLIVVVHGLFQGLLGEGSLQVIYLFMAIMPLVLLGIPILSSAISLERRAGSLDLALAVPSTERYFLRRVAPACVFLIVQAWILTPLAFYLGGQGDRILDLVSAKAPAATLTLLPVFLHAFLVGLLIGAVTLFWATRIATTGGTMVASFVTVLALSKWAMASPIVSSRGASTIMYLDLIHPSQISVAWNLLVTALAIVLFYLYARERLRRPELMLA